nr:gfo/Idh/MocA family oxidoreductase [Prolixibacteraceae bacterium]
WSMHHQWALEMDGSGPVEISPIGDGTQFMKFVYENGVVMTSEPFDDAWTKGVKFIGADGWLEVSRGHFKASNDEWLPKNEAVEQSGSYETKVAHHIDFVEAVRERRDPVVPVEVGHSSCTVCTLGNIACELGRTIKWDPKNETFIDDVDGAASKMLHYQYRDGWSLL